MHNMGGEEKCGGVVKEMHHTCDVRPTMAGAPYRAGMGGMLGMVIYQVVGGLIRRPEGGGPPREECRCR